MALMFSAKGLTSCYLILSCTAAALLQLLSYVGKNLYMADKVHWSSCGC